MITSSQMGEYSEDVAVEFLRKEGYEILERNWRCRQGEIDIIARKGSLLVFVEVRSKRSTILGHPLWSVDNKKRARLLMAARLYLSRKGLWHMGVRFDVIGIVVGEKGVDISHERDVFQEGEALGDSNAYWQPW